MPAAFYVAIYFVLYIYIVSVCVYVIQRLFEVYKRIAQVICKYDAILYKGLEHQWVWYPRGSWNQSPCISRDDCVQKQKQPENGAKWRGTLSSDELNSTEEKVGIFLSKISPGHFYRSHFFVHLDSMKMSFLYSEKKALFIFHKYLPNAQYPLPLRKFGQVDLGQTEFFGGGGEDWIIPVLR